MTQLFIPDGTAKVLIVGDVILDRYVHGSTTRISPEAPVPVVHVQETEERPGGAGNVALNICSLGIRACLVGITGDDPASDNLTGLLGNAGVDCRFVRQKAFPTITKLRVLSQHQQLLRLDYETSATAEATAPLLELFTNYLPECRLVVLSDYAKGGLMQAGDFIKAGLEAGLPVLVDPKGSDFTRYHGATLLTPNLKEFESVVGPCSDDEAIAAKGHELCRSISLEALLVTRGEHGMTLIRPDREPVHLETHAREVFDVTGAGDTVIAAMAAALASGNDFVRAMAMANRAAGLVVARLGAASVTTEELNTAIRAESDDNNALPGKEQLLEKVRQMRSRGETVVMTNGCFDILHAGHVDYLQKAKAMGDHLIVAVNDDDSVRRLKGPGRPINPLQQRMAVLAALKPVDYIIAFSEDTPEQLIAEVLPDVLVKGGDYEPEQIAGSRQVLDNGGEIKIIPFTENCSTSRIIDMAKTAQEGKP